MSDIQERIKELRNQLNLTQKDFAEKIGISRDLMAQIERKNSTPSLTVVTNIVNEFNISYRWLITGEKVMLSSDQQHEPERISSDSKELEKARIKIQVLEEFIEKFLSKFEVKPKE